MSIQGLLAGARFRAPLMLAIVVLTLTAATPASSGFFDFLFGSQDSGDSGRSAKPSVPSSGLPNLFEPDRPAAPQQAHANEGISRATSTHCVRMCDGKYFPLLNRGGTSPVTMCQAFCPASPTKVFFGGNIDRALSMDGERYSEIKTAYAYRKALTADCTCNGRDPAGLAPIDISLDATLRPGDIVATATGLVAYNGPRNGNRQNADFTPVANYPGLTADARARLGEMKVAPVSAGIDEEYTMSVDAMRTTGSETPRPALD